jgi:GTP diphosphokinase / guanosine-3',5'-bis(diphosphate) 3'-diphosphatase
MQQDTPIDNQEELNDEQDRQLIAKEYRKLLQLFDNKLNAEDQRLIREAFELAREAHKEVRRKDGDPYITHPIKVACICVEEIGLGPTAAACALLHDVVEDTDVTLDELRIQFPDADGKKDKNGLPKSKIADIVDGLTKLKESQEGTSTQAENISKVLKAMLTDVRVVLIKMADRLHNMRTIGSMRPDKQIKIAAETESVYTPLAHQLGLYEIKSELQDMCMKITYPDEYRDIKQKLAEKKESREAYIDRFILPIREQLDEFGINARIFGRPKSIYSIWGKMKKQKILFENIMDLFAIRIIVNVPMKVEKITCWQAYAIVTDV